jgi:hypothetical protein
MRTLSLCLLAALSLLAGCADMRVIESEVQTTAAPNAGAANLTAAKYRFERLPSQAKLARTREVEALVQVALNRVGLVRDDAAPRYSVLPGMREQVVSAGRWERPITDPFYRRGRIVAPDTRFPSAPRYRREVHLLIRDLRSGTIVYETHAVNVSSWSDTDAVLAAMLEAALQGFPQAPEGVRTVSIEIPTQ